MTFTSLALLYVITLVVFLGVDAVWLKMVMKPLFYSHIGHLLADPIRFGVAGGFYVFYVAGILYFASVPAMATGSVASAFLNGAILGFLAYGTYEFTSYAVMKDWHWAMVVVDTAWGTVLTGGSAAIGVWVLKTFS